MVILSKNSNLVVENSLVIKTNLQSSVNIDIKHLGNIISVDI